MERKNFYITELLIVSERLMKRKVVKLFKGALSNTFRGVGAALVLVLYDEI